MGAMQEVIKAVGFLLAFFNLGLTICTIALPDWRVNDVEGEVVELIKRTQGLWVKCAFFPTGNWQCEDYDRFFIALPSAITGARVFSCLSLVFQLFIVVTLPFGMTCTSLPFGENALKQKAKLTILNGALSIVAAISIGTAVSWYAALVVEDYNRDIMGQSQGIETSIQRYIYGKALYVGWIAMTMLTVQGVFLCCSSWNDDFEGYQSAGHQYGNAPYDPYQGGTKYSGMHEDSVGQAAKYGMAKFTGHQPAEHGRPDNQNYI